MNPTDLSNKKARHTPAMAGSVLPINNISLTYNCQLRPEAIIQMSWRESIVIEEDSVFLKTEYLEAA